MIDVGRLCIKTAGREAGRVCCVVKKVDAQFVLVSGPLTHVRRRKCNILHLEPLTETLEIAADATDADLSKAFAASAILQKLGVTPPSKEELKQREQQRAEKDKAKAARAEKERKEREAFQKRAAEEAAKKQEEKKAEAKKPRTKPATGKVEKTAKPEPAAVRPEPASPREPPAPPS